MVRLKGSHIRFKTSGSSCGEKKQEFDVKFKLHKHWIIWKMYEIFYHMSCHICWIFVTDHVIWILFFKPHEGGTCWWSLCWEKKIYKHIFHCNQVLQIYQHRTSPLRKHIFHCHQVLKTIRFWKLTNIEHSLPIVRTAVYWNLKVNPTLKIQIISGASSLGG